MTRGRLKVFGWLILVGIAATLWFLGVYSENHWFHDTTETRMIDGKEWTTGSDHNGFSGFFFLPAVFITIIAFGLALNRGYDKWRTIPD